MTEPQEEMVDFDEFRRMVGAAEPTVRKALKALGIDPIPLFNDRRKLRYPVAEVERVQNWIRQNLRNL